MKLPHDPAHPHRKPYAAVIVTGWTPEGRPIRRSRSASSKREAEAMLTAMLDAHHMALPLPDDRLTVGKWVLRWLETTRVRATTREAYELVVRRDILPRFGTVPLRRLTVAHVAGLLADLTDAGYSPHTVAGSRAVLSTALREAMREGYLERNVASLAKGPRMTVELRTAPSPATVRALLAALEEHRLHPLYVLLAGTGLRVSEALGLRWEDLDVREELPTERARGAGDGSGSPGSGLPPPASGGVDERRASRAGAAPLVRDRGLPPGAGGPVLPRTLTVRYQLTRIRGGEYVLAEPKTPAARRTVALPPPVVAALEAWRTAQKRERLAAGRKWRDGTGLVFTRPSGEPVALSTVEWVLGEACKRVGVAHVAPHDLRRWYLTQVESRVGREVAQRMAGHTTAQMTSRYTSATPDMLERAADAVAEALG